MFTSSKLLPLLAVALTSRSSPELFSLSLFIKSKLTSWHIAWLNIVQWTIVKKILEIFKTQ